MARTRSWFPIKDNDDAKSFLDSQINVGSNETDLKSASTSCARGIVRIVNQQLTAAIAGSIQYLRNPSEAREIGTSAHDIEFSLERFERKHDDSVKSFYAYISAPSSTDLLREHGFVGFDESGEQAVHTRSINALECNGFAAISNSSESCKERLRLVSREVPEDFDLPMDDDEESLDGSSVLSDDYCKLVVERVNAVCQQRVDTFLSSLSERVDHFINEIDAERMRAASSKMRICRARATLLGRSALVFILLLASIFAFSELAPNQFNILLSAISDRLIESILVGVVSTFLVLAFIYIIAGAKNENVRLALRPAFIENWASWTKRRHLATALKACFDDFYDRLVDDLNEMPLQVDNAIAEGVVEWLKSHSESHQKAENILTEFRQVIVARCKLFDEFIGVVSERLNEIPVELSETANEIKNNVIEEHMSRIRNAAVSFPFCETG